MKPITISSHGYKLAGNLFVAKNPQKLAFLFIQGWLGHQNRRAAQALADLGFTCITYDMRGNGGSEGNLEESTRADFIADAAVAYDFLERQLSPDSMIGVVGSSFGSYTGILLSERRPVICLSLRVPANYPDKGYTEPQKAQFEVSHDFVKWRQRKLAYAENRALEALHNFKGNVQIIRAGADEIVPRQVAENYVDAIAARQQLEYVVMESAPHSLVSDQLSEKYTKLLAGWAKRFLK